MVYKYVDVSPLNETRYFHELAEKFESPVRTALYCLSFVLLSLHLKHGFSSSFQSVGFNNKYSKGLKNFGLGFAFVVPFGFIFIALFHHFNH
jgi:succinate dehydrogenase / fumarate reductase cytochrome b subunit